jgi:hypothetical protein
VVIIEEKEPAKDIITEFSEYIRAEILADIIEFRANVSNGTQIDVNNDIFTVKVSKKSI